MSEISLSSQQQALEQPTDYAVEQLRLPPNSTEAESSLLGGLLLDNNAWDKISDLVQITDFYQKSHQLIFSAILGLINQQKPADVITVFEWLKDLGQDESTGGLTYLNSLAQYVANASNIRRYGEIVRERAILRKLISASDDIATSAFNTKGRVVAEILDEAENRIFRIGEENSRVKQGFISINVLTANLIEKVTEMAKNPNDLTGIATGFIDLDSKTSGLQPGDLLILAARPSMGKTSLAVNIAENIAIKEALPVAIFSMEMGADQLAVRIVGSIAGISQSKLRTGNLKDDEWERLTDALQDLENANIFIDETPGLSIAELRASARRLTRSNGQLGLIVVDYLQLMSASTSSNTENRAGELGEISRGLKMLAKELKCPIIALSQLNRSVEARSDKRPLMSDLRESGALEQDADVIMFIYRDDYYNKDKSNKPNIAEIIIGKQRNGPTGTVELFFEQSQTKFKNLAKQDIDSY